MKGIMMKRRNSIALAGLVAVSLGCNSTIQAKKNDGFVQGACAVGAALFGIAGAVALVDWCCSETDDQMIGRITAEYNSINAQYHDTMAYFGQISGMTFYVSAAHKPFNRISESVLHDFATYIWHTNSTQYAYRSNVIAVKNQLKASVKGLRKRVRDLQCKACKHEGVIRFEKMYQLLNVSEALLTSITLFADCLEYHKPYFNMYDSVDTIRNRYLSLITIFESGRYSIPIELKRCIVSVDTGQYALRTFVKTIESDIATLKSDMRSLEYNYPEKRQYVNGLLDCLIAIKNIIMIDPRYQQELYEWEQARLQRLQLEALQAQARAERDRLYAMKQANRILEERNRIEREKLWQARLNSPYKNDTDVSVSINFTI